MIIKFVVIVDDHEFIIKNYIQVIKDKIQELINQNLKSLDVLTINNLFEILENETKYFLEKLFNYLKSNF